jgi:hypothetical protein
MARPSPDPLALSRTVLRALVALNLIMGVLILALLTASLIAETPVMGALGVRPPQGHSRLFAGMRLIMLLGICAVPVAHFVLTRLLTIVKTVSAGNPFVVANARRLQAIAWGMLGLELMHVSIGIVAASVSTAAAPLHLNWEFSLTRWLAVLMLFVLARVFEQAAQMREELEGTV